MELSSKDLLYLENEDRANGLCRLTLIILCICTTAAFLISGREVLAAGRIGTVHLMACWWLAVTASDAAAIELMRVLRSVRTLRWLTKYILAYALCLTIAADVYFWGRGYVWIFVPIFLACRYYDSRHVLIVSAAVMLIDYQALVLGRMYGVFADRTAVQDTLMTFAVNELLVFAVFVIIALNVAGSGRKLIEQQLEAGVREAAIEGQLRVAADIQTGILPHGPLRCSEGPAPRVEIGAFMRPAREVGGDLYDYFMADDTHVCFVIGDVSGKGIPAALFMSMAKMGIKIYAETGCAPSRVFEMANNMLCESNEMMMFVTAWIGILDIETGELVCCSGGHNPVMARLGGGGFRMLRPKRNLALAVMEGCKYKDERLMLSDGDIILMYTDGVVEAHDGSGGLFGEERLLRVADSCADLPLTDILSRVKAGVDEFAGDAEQFDDITMLAVRYRSADGSGAGEAV